MNPGIRILFILSLIVVFSACRNKSKTTESRLSDHHTSQQSLDWQGVYIGVLPCQDCEGIQTLLLLNTDNTYIMETSYLGKSSEIFTQQGTFSWSARGNSIKLRPETPNATPVAYAVGENRLMQLDEKENRTWAKLEENHILTKDDTGIFEKHWKLFEINGTRIENPGTMNSEAFIIFKAIGNRVHGSGGCNRMGGTYEISPNGRIAFSQMMSTKMGCPDMQTEIALFEVFEKADTFSISGDTLSLSRERTAPLARFVAIR